MSVRRLAVFDADLRLRNWRLMAPIERLFPGRAGLAMGPPAIFLVRWKRRQSRVARPLAALNTALRPNGRVIHVRDKSLERVYICYRGRGKQPDCHCCTGVQRSGAIPLWKRARGCALVRCAQQ